MNVICPKLAAMGLCLCAFLCGCYKEQAERAEREAEELRKKTQQALVEAEHLANQIALVKAAKEAKAELDKVFPTKKEYELIYATPEEGPDKLKEHDARLQKMDRVEIKGLTVGYEQRSDCSLAGKSFERHFRASWVTDGKVVGLSYYTQEKTDLVAFVDLLQRLVPITNEAFRHVQVKRGG